MSLEFDIWRHTSPYTPGANISEHFFTVSHSTPGSATLKHYLQSVLEWHHSAANHPPILICLDIKSQLGDYDDFHLQIDTYLRNYFDESLIYSPSRFASASGGDLCQKVMKAGWDEVDAMRGKFIFCLSGNVKWKSEYADHNLLTQRLCFSDRDFSDDDADICPPNSGNFIFFNFHIFHANREIWMKTIPPFTERNFITRAYEVNSMSNWADCMTAKVSALATNKISNHVWAMVSNAGAYISK